MARGKHFIADHPAAARMTRRNSIAVLVVGMFLVVDAGASTWPNLGASGSKDAFVRVARPKPVCETVSAVASDTTGDPSVPAQ